MHFQNISTFVLFPQVIVEGCQKVFEVGTNQYEEFVYTRFVVGSADVVTTPLKRNGLTAHLKHIKTTNSCQLKLSTDMLTKSRAVCDVRKDAAKQAFSYEFICVPECLVDKLGNAYHSNKLDNIKIAAP